VLSAVSRVNQEEGFTLFNELLDADCWTLVAARPSRARANWLSICSR